MKCREKILVKSQCLYYLAVELARLGIYQSRRRRVGVFLFLYARELIRKVFGYHEKVCNFIKPTLCLIRIQLVYSIERLELYARTRIQFFKGHTPVHFVHYIRSPVVAVGIYGPPFAVLAYEHIVATPGIYCNACNLRVLSEGNLYALPDACKQSVYIPYEVTALFLYAVGETVHFLSLYFAVLFPADYVSAGRRAYIYRKKIFHDLCPLCSLCFAAGILHLR